MFLHNSSNTLVFTYTLFCVNPNDKAFLSVHISLLLANMQCYMQYGDDNDYVL